MKDVVAFLARDILENDFYDNLDAWEDTLEVFFAKGVVFTDVQTAIREAVSMSPNRVDGDRVRALSTEARVFFEVTSLDHAS